MTTRPPVEVEGLRFAYPGTRRPAVDGVSFSVRAGEVFGFLGPNGAGKSTTQKLLIRLLTGYEGSVFMLDRDLKRWDNRYYEHIGVGFEFPNHYLKLTGRENLRLFRSLYAGRTTDPEELLRMVDLSADGDTPVARYSKGMKTRLGFARALLNDPEVLFLDEPTSGLDPVGARRIKDIILARKAAGTTVFLTTHNMHDAAELCDRVAFMVDGRIRLTDSPRRLMVERGRAKVRVEYREEGRPASREFGLRGLGADQEFLRLIRDKELETIHSEEATLEDVFIESTGERLT